MENNPSPAAPSACRSGGSPAYQERPPPRCLVLEKARLQERVFSPLEEITSWVLPISNANSNLAALQHDNAQMGKAYSTQIP